MASEEIIAAPVGALASQSASIPRIRSLDSVRGVAALIVVFHHLLYTIPDYGFHHIPFHGGTWDYLSWLNRTPLMLLHDGPGAVLVFFALSGLVLSKSFIEADKFRVTPFLIKRVVRVWIPFAAAILASALLEAQIGGGSLPNYSHWFNDYSWSQPATVSAIANHLWLLAPGSIELDNPMWSLIHELRISLIFPIFAYFAVGRPRAGMTMALALLLGGPFLHHGHGWLLSEVAVTGSYAFIFMGGAIVGAHLQSAQRAARSLHWLAFVGAWLACAVLLALSPPQNNGGADSIRGALHLLTGGLGALILVTLCTTDNIVTRQLERSAPMWLGRISYSLYLIHLPILLAIAHLWPNAGLAVVFTATVALSLLAATAMSRLIEMPSQKIGRWLALRAAPAR